MDREIKFRAWDGEKMISNVLPFQWDFVLTAMFHKCVKSNGPGILGSGGTEATFEIPGYRYKSIMQFTSLKDKNGVEIYEGDILEFADKWEWYRNSYGIKMRSADPERRKELQEMYDKEPMERRVIEIPGCYEWLLSTEIQTYWHVIGNIYQHPELLKQEPVTP